MAIRAENFKPSILDYIIIGMMAIFLIAAIAQDALRKDYEIWCIADQNFGVKYIVTADGGITPLRGHDGRMIGCVTSKISPAVENK